MSFNIIDCDADGIPQSIKCVICKNSIGKTSFPNHKKQCGKRKYNE